MKSDLFDVFSALLIGVVGSVLCVAWLAAIFLLPAIGFLWLIGWLK